MADYKILINSKNSPIRRWGIPNVRHGWTLKKETCGKNNRKTEKNYPEKAVEDGAKGQKELYEVY